VPPIGGEGKILEPLHGSVLGPVNRARAEEAARRARSILIDEQLKALIGRPDRAPVPRARQMFVNRNLRMSNVSAVGFDMDYTLAIYHLRRIEQLSFEMTVAKLIASFGYGPELSDIKYDHSFVMRGLFVDKAHGNLLKIDRYGYVGRAYHGREELTDEQRHKLYRNERIRLKNPEYAWIDTLFALPEACLFAEAIELFERKQGKSLDYAKLYDDIREAIDTVHRDNSLKEVIRKDIGRYIFKDPELGPALHKLRSGGKKLFILTNSLWDYTDAVMGYLLDHVVPEYPSWKNYFDVVVTGASKPGFFAEGKSFLEIDASTSAENRVIGEATVLERGKVYQGGNLAAFEKLTHLSGESVLYVGDHIYGDILKSKKTSMWRTCMVVQEIEDEILYTEARREEIDHLAELERLLPQVDDEIASHKSSLNAIEKKLERDHTLDAEQRAAIEVERKRVKGELDKLRKTYKESMELAATLERDIELGFNPYWGLLFKEGNENSRFGEQVEQYACVYTSRVSNFGFYSPMQYFRSPRELMPHEQAGGLTSKLSILGDEEGLPRGANRAE
jgi:HAD superfamily 5'-nucleotidase-like hydrolase